MIVLIIFALWCCVVVVLGTFALVMVRISKKADEESEKEARERYKSDARE